MTISIVAETKLLNKRGTGGYVHYMDEFPGSKSLTKVVYYIILCKEGCVESINIKYKETKPL
jgi:hypothetical protein